MWVWTLNCHFYLDTSFILTQFLNELAILSLYHFISTTLITFYKVGWVLCSLFLRNSCLFWRGLGQREITHADTQVSEEGGEETLWNSHFPPAPCEMADRALAVLRAHWWRKVPYAGSISTLEQGIYSEKDWRSIMLGLSVDGRIKPAGDPDASWSSWMTVYCGRAPMLPHRKTVRRVSLEGKGAAEARLSRLGLAATLILCPTLCHMMGKK